ncbi:HalOD1 output domain-containing protein [Natrialbaceae archaeon A-arb3/5]
MPSVDDSADAPDEYDTSYTTTFDPTEKDQPTEAVVTAVASLVEQDPMDLPPLYEVVDSDALNSLVEHAYRTESAGVQQLSFIYEGFDVSVRSDGQVLIANPTTGSSSNT